MCEIDVTDNEDSTDLTAGKSFYRPASEISFQTFDVYGNPRDGAEFTIVSNGEPVPNVPAGIPFHVTLAGVGFIDRDRMVLISNDHDCANVENDGEFNTNILGPVGYMPAGQELSSLILGYEYDEQNEPGFQPINTDRVGLCSNDQDENGVLLDPDCSKTRRWRYMFAAAPGVYQVCHCGLGSCVKNTFDTVATFDVKGPEAKIIHNNHAARE